MANDIRHSISVFFADKRMEKHKGDRRALNRALAESILRAVGGRLNVLHSTSCMTRLRLKLANPAEVNLELLNGLAGVLAVVDAGEQLQIVLGPGKAKQVAVEMETLLAKQQAGDGSRKANDLKAELAARNKTPVKLFLTKLSAIFVPLIPAVVASGMVAGVTNVAVRLGADPQNTVIQMLNVVGWGLFSYLAIFVGFHTAGEFGGTPALGGLAGVLLINPAIATIQFDGMSLVPGRGGIIGGLVVAGFMAWLEQRIRRHVPKALDIIVTPTVTLLVGGMVTYLLLQPIGGFLSDCVVKLFQSILNMGGIVSGAILAGFFLPLVMTGLHQGLTPVHMEFLNTLRANPLLPVLAMAGAGQVGAAIAVLSKTQNHRLREIIKGALPVGFLGIGEPLIFGVTLPLGRPFVAACAGASIAGAFQATLQVQSIAMGVSGLPLAFLIRGDQIPTYLLGLGIAYVSGFVITWFVGFEDPPNESAGLEK